MSIKKTTQNNQTAEEQKGSSVPEVRVKPKNPQDTRKEEPKAAEQKDSSGSEVRVKPKNPQDTREEKPKFDGAVTKLLPDTKFIVELDNGHKVTCVLSGKMRKMYIRVAEGDRVTVEVSPYDIDRGRITYRQK